MPVRKLNNASPLKLLGMLPDTAKTQHLTESALEMENLHRHMFNPKVECFEVQPLQIKLLHDGTIRRYTPDVAIMYRDSDVLEVEEVKPLQIAQSEKFQHLEQAVRLVFEKMGHRFVVTTEETIRAQPRLTNLGILYRYHRFPATATEVRRVLSWFLTGPKTLCTTRLLADEAGISIGVVYFLIANHQLWADLDEPFDNKLFIQGVNHD